MKRLLCSFIAFCLHCHAQTVADVQNEIASSKTNNTVALTVTASQGDGTVCTLKKQSGSSIVASLSCVSGDGKTVLNSGTLRSTGATTQFLPFGFGDVLCLLGINSTATAATMGSLGTIPVNGLGWSCSTNIASGGVITGQTAPVNGSVVWP
jgi:uncharacterized Zn-binding protein involved in type VI secretion